MATKKLPKQLYVTFKNQGIDPMTGPNPAFGFLHPYEPGKSAFEKKRKTQEDWAYNLAYLIDGRVEQRGNDYFKVGFRIDYDRTKPWGTPGHQIRVPVDELLEFPPKVWDNTPMRGFKVMKSVSRFSTSNKLWRIMDPRKAEFEITTACMEELIDTAGILKGGEIDAQCAWMANKILVVVP